MSRIGTDRMFSRTSMSFSKLYRRAILSSGSRSKTSVRIAVYPFCGSKTCQYPEANFVRNGRATFPNTRCLRVNDSDE